MRYNGKIGKRTEKQKIKWLFDSSDHLKGKNYFRYSEKFPFFRCYF